MISKFSQGKKTYSWVGLEGPFLKTDCPYKPTFSTKKIDKIFNCPYRQASEKIVLIDQLLADFSF